MALRRHEAMRTPGDKSVIGVRGGVNRAFEMYYKVGKAVITTRGSLGGTQKAS